MDKRLENVKKLKELKAEYKETPIPAELDFVVRRALKRKRKTYLKPLIGAGAAALIFVTGINTSSTLAHAFSDVPVIGSVVKLLTFREYTIEDENFQANVKVPALTNLKNKELEQALNTKYLEENKKLYEEFVAQMEEWKGTGAHLGVDSGFKVMTDNERIFSIQRFVTETAASSATTVQYDTIDKQNQILITLPSLFKDESYIEVISANIISQMREQMSKDSNQIYWVRNETNGDDMLAESFKAIDKAQSFYITEDHKLVISFDEYKVAPGYMGVVEFEIPTEILSSILVSNEYVK